MRKGCDTFPYAPFHSPPGHWGPGYCEEPVLYEPATDKVRTALPTVDIGSIKTK